MIIEAILTVLLKVWDTLLILNIPQLPDNVMGYIETLFDYLVTGASILANYTPLSYLLTLFFVLLAVDTGIVIYHFVMWVIRKIPMLSMS